jgi:hypothetical protein
LQHGDIDDATDLCAAATELPCLDPQ